MPPDGFRTTVVDLMDPTDAVEIPRLDAAIFIGLTARLELYLGEPDDRTLHALVDRLRRDLVRYGLASEDAADQARAVRSINERLHLAVGDL
jgi:hypothetical protein